MKKCAKQILFWMTALFVLLQAGALAKAKESYTVPKAAYEVTIKATDAIVAHNPRKAIQNEMDQAAKRSGYTKIILKGKFVLNGRLYIQSNTILDATDATITTSLEQSALLANGAQKERETTGGYALTKNIWILGGVWDGGDLAKKKNKSNNMTICHATNVRIIGAKFQNNYGSHFLEICGVDDALVQDCDFVGDSRANGQDKLALQMDIAYTNHMPSGYKGDKTINKNVRILANKFNSGGKGYSYFPYCIGINTEYTKENLWVKNLKIEENTFYHVGKNGMGVLIKGVDGYSISSNTFSSPEGNAIHVLRTKNGVIDGNKVTSCGADSVFIHESTVKTVNKNTITSGKADGIHMDSSTVKTMNNNTIKSCKGYGINVLKGSVTKAQNNVLSGNKKGNTNGVKNTTTAQKTKTVNAKSIKLNLAKATLGVGETLKLTATVSPSNTTNKKVTYSSSNKAVASVSSAGKITARKTGTAKITAKTANGKKAVFAVTVKKAPSKIALKKTKIQLKVKGIYTVQVKLPAKTASYKLTYKTSNKAVATVNSKGKITAKKKGKAIITVTTFNGKKAQIQVVVK